MRAILVLFLAAATLGAAVPVGGSAGTLQPGDVVTFGNSQCTLNFVYDGQGALLGNVYLGVAAHCVSGVGQSASTTGHGNFGTVAFVGNEDEVTRDYAFVKVRSDLEGIVSAHVLGHPGLPAGGATGPTETDDGDVLKFSGYGVAFGATGPTRERRLGVLTYDDARLYRGEGPIIFGDSGGPVLHESGQALGLVSQIVVGCCPDGGTGSWIEGPTIQGVLADASARGFPVALRSAA